MRETFGEWYWPDEDNLRDVVSGGLIVLDANVLLDLYRHSATTREDLFATLEHELIRPRLRLPYQAGLEFHRNRLEVVGTHANQYAAVDRALDELRESSDRVLGDLFGAVRGVRDQGVREDLERVSRKAAKRLAKRVRRELRAARDVNAVAIEDVRVNDPLRDRIERLFGDAGQVGALPLADDHEALLKVAHERVKSKRPPGTADRHKPDEGVGDPLIWIEMKKLSSDAALPVLFVSGDTKSDWMEKVHGKTLGPLPLLRREFFDDTGQTFHKTTWRGLLGYAAKYLSVKVAAKTFEVVEADEQQDRRRRWADALVSELDESAAMNARVYVERLGDTRLSAMGLVREHRPADGRSAQDIYREIYPDVFGESLRNIVAEHGGVSGLEKTRDAFRALLLQDTGRKWLSAAGVKSDGFETLRSAAQSGALRRGADRARPRDGQALAGAEADTNGGLGEVAADEKALRTEELDCAEEGIA